eukprot:scaffold738_cov340-Pavlova_lutheri.AAC.18
MHDCKPMVKFCKRLKASMRSGDSRRQHANVEWRPIARVQEDLYEMQRQAKITSSGKYRTS